MDVDLQAGAAEDYGGAVPGLPELAQLQPWGPEVRTSAQHQCVAASEALLSDDIRAAAAAQPLVAAFPPPGAPLPGRCASGELLLPPAQAPLLLDPPAGLPVLAALGAGPLPAAPACNSPAEVAAAVAAVAAASATSEATGSCIWQSAGDDEVSEHAPCLVRQALEEHCTDDMLARLSVLDLSQVCPATAAVLQERLSSGRPDLVQQVLYALVGEP
jgi:hypothetical protein